MRPLRPQAAGTLPAAAAAPWPGTSPRVGPGAPGLVGWGWGSPEADEAPSLSTAVRCSAAWPSCDRRGSGGASSSRSTACTTTASAGATTASAAPTSTTPTRWPCAPGAFHPRTTGLGEGSGGPWGPLHTASCSTTDPLRPRRFLRGTCKKTDGTCPFSHHVSKEKVSAPTASRSPAPVLPGGGLGASPLSHHEQGGPCTWHPPRGAEPGWCHSGAATRLREAGLAEAAATTAFPLEELEKNQHFSP